MKVFVAYSYRWRGSDNPIPDWEICELDNITKESLTELEGELYKSKGGWEKDYTGLKIRNVSVIG